MDPAAKSIIATRIDGYTWAVTTDDGWILLITNDIIRGIETVMSSSQMRAVGHQVEDTLSKFEGEQCIHLGSQDKQVKLVC